MCNLSPRGGKRDNGAKKLCFLHEILAENVPCLKKSQPADPGRFRIDTRKIILRHVMVRLPKTKDEERIWTTARKIYIIIMYRKTMMQNTTDFS